MNTNTNTNTYFGFTDSMQPMNKVRTQNTLDKQYRYSDGVMTCKEHIYQLLQAGATTKIDDDYSYYSSKTQAMTKPKTEYQIHFIIQDDGKEIAVYNSVTKTEYDYCNYLIDNGFIDSTKANQFVINEQNRIKVEQETQANTERLQKEAEQKEKEEQEQFKTWLTEQATQYNDTAKIELQKQIFLHEVGQYSLHATEVLVLIDNIDDARCKAELRSRLWYSNTASKKTFEHVTGIKLAPTDKETFRIFDKITKADYKGMTEFKPRQTQEQKEEYHEIFYFFDCVQRSYVECDGIPFSKYGLDLFIRKNNNRILISEAKSGTLMCSAKTRTEAISQLSKIVEQYTIEGVNKLLNESIGKYGISPKYQEQNTAQVAS